MRAGPVRQEAGSAWPALRALALPGVLALWGALASAQTLAQPAAQTAAQAAAQTAAELPAALPPEISQALAQARVADANSAFVVLPLDGGALQLARHESLAMNPASTMKLLTTYAALGSLGPAYHWHTAVFASRPVQAGRLDGDLIVRGDGDPSLVIERWWLLVQRLRGMGLRDIHGDLVIDRSRFAAGLEGGPSLDGNELRPYNVAPNALLVNFKVLSLEFVPDHRAGIAHVLATPALEGLSVPAQVPLSGGGCPDWKAQLRADFAQAHAVHFHGSYPGGCGSHTWHVSLLSPDAYALASFRALWRAAGGSFHGGVREGRVPAAAIPLAVHESPPLTDVIRDINKNSNNVMARQLFLTLGAGPRGPAAARDMPGSSAVAEGAEALLSAQAEEAEPASPARAIAQVQAWLALQGLAMPELVLENGSGLSRIERIAPASLARLLVQAWNSRDMPNFLASLPQAGVDGTMKERAAAGPAAYVKTGTLAEVRAVAGYVFASSGHRYAVVGIINDPHAEAAQAAHDAFLQWVWREG